MRIIAGSAGGRRLKAPAGSQTRPTSDRVREAMFSILGTPPETCRVLDLFAGAGTLGLEAWSRGASHVDFCERNGQALDALKHNLRSLDAGGETRVHRGDSIATLKRLAKRDEPYHWIFIDPPYATSLADDALSLLASNELLTPDGTVIVEHDRRRAPAEACGSLVQSDQRRYGDTCIAFYTWSLA